MFELKGVPTHQNSAGTQSSAVNYTPGALDLITEYQYRAAVSIGGTQLMTELEDTRDSVTAAQSLVNEGAGQIATV